MATVATLVLGIDGSTSLGGDSEGVTSPTDRARFLSRRRTSDCLIIGGNTARSDRYQKTPAPLVILSRSLPDLISENPLAHWWNLSPADAVARARAQFGDEILIEAGISIITELLNLGAIDQLELSITQASGGENRIEVHELLKHFTAIDKTEVNDTIFYSCSWPITPPK
ncbi:MAG: dihydrofolate reductase family protein [Actinomycetota bacterium]